MINRTKIQNPVAVREIDDPEILFFRSIDEVLDDTYDCLWGEEYEGWDARATTFHIRRTYPKPKWWQRILNQDSSFLELTELSESPSIEAKTILAQYLNVSVHTSECDVKEMIQIGIERFG